MASASGTVLILESDACLCKNYVGRSPDVTRISPHGLANDVMAAIMSAFAHMAHGQSTRRRHSDVAPPTLGGEPLGCLQRDMPMSTLFKLSGGTATVGDVTSAITRIFETHMQPSVWLKSAFNTAVRSGARHLEVHAHELYDLRSAVDMFVASGFTVTFETGGTLMDTRPDTDCTRTDTDCTRPDTDCTRPDVGKRAVLIQGRKGSGKSTLAALLTGFSEVSFAQPLRDIAVDLFNALAPAFQLRVTSPLTKDLCVNQATKERCIMELIGAADPHVNGGWPCSLMLNGRPLTPRWLLQWLGTDVCRALMGDNVWLDTAMSRIECAGMTRIVISDVRFLNEATHMRRMLESKGFTTFAIRLVNPADAPLGPDAHASEADIESLPHDACLVNDQTRGVDEFVAAARAALVGIL